MMNNDQNILYFIFGCDSNITTSKQMFVSFTKLKWAKKWMSNIISNKKSIAKELSKK